MKLLLALGLLVIVQLSFAKYRGCYRDTGSRDLTHMKPGRNINVPSCISYCKARRYLYAGVQNGNQCFCGNSFGRYGIRHGRECNKRCPDISNGGLYYCGGAWRNAVYDTGYLVTYYGCYRDTSVRVLPHMKPGRNPNVVSCTSYCSGKTYKYAGVQNGDQCFCGDRYGIHHPRPEQECNKTCPSGNNYCGGIWRNGIYYTGYLGCFTDAPSRDLPVFISMGSSASPVECQNLCKARRYKYAGVQNHNQCFCGNSYGRYRRMRKNECGLPCRGNSQYRCGGTWRNAIYKSRL